MLDEAGGELANLPSAQSGCLAESEIARIALAYLFADSMFSTDTSCSYTFSSISFFTVLQ